MPAAGAKRKRPNRKRKRRAVSISSSSSDSDNDSSSTDAGPKITVVKTAIASPEEKEKEESSDSDSDSDSSEDSDSDSSSEDAQPVLPKNDGPRIRSDSPGPIPPSASRIPSFLPSNSHESNEKSVQGGQQKGTETKEAEEALREKFNKFWMSSLVEGFKDDLDTIRKVRDVFHLCSRFSLPFFAFTSNSSFSFLFVASSPRSSSNFSGPNVHYIQTIHVDRFVSFRHRGV